MGKTARISEGRIFFIVGIIHKSIFGHEMSEAMKGFLKNLSWSFFGGVTAAGIMFLLTIVAGRTLGPEAFGQYNSLLSFATALSIFFLLGNDVSSVRYLADKQYENKREEIFTTALVVVLFQSVFFSLIYYIFFDFIKEKFALGNELLLTGIIFSFLLAIKSLFDGFLRAFHLIKKQGFIRIFDASLALFSFLLFYHFLHRTDYFFYVVSVSLGLFSFSILSLFLLFGNFKRFSFKMLKLLFEYNKYLILGTVAGFIVSLEKYFIGRYTGTYELGVYSAYHAASFLIIANIGSVFTNVFWPSSVTEKKSLEAISTKLDILFLKIFPLWAVFNFFFIYIVIIFMGESYPLDYVYIVLFAVNSFLSFAFSTINGLLKVNRVMEFVVTSSLCYLSLILLIVVFKSVLAYLIGQIFVYIAFYLISKRRLRKDFFKE